MVTVKKGDLHGINIDARNIPDLVPIISVAKQPRQMTERPSAQRVPRGLK